MRLTTNKEAETMPPKNLKREEEGKKTVNLAHYALVLANKKIEMLGTSEDQTDLERMIGEIQLLIKKECGMDIEDFIYRADHGKIKVSEENYTLILGMFRLIAKQLEALKIVSTYDIKV